MSDYRRGAAVAKSIGKRPLEEVEIIGVANISPPDTRKGVRVKVYRKWTVTPARGSRQPTFSCILLDQQGGAIQANAEGRERIRFDKALRENEAYTITGFGLLDTKPWLRTLPNPFTLILGSATDIQPFPVNGFPLHHFNFATYDELYLRADRNDIVLTDYIGCVLNAGDLQEPRLPSQKQVIWRDIMLRNLEGDTVRFTLWNENAKAFDKNAYEKESGPTVMAVSSCWVKTYRGLQLSSTPATYYYFNPAIPETDYILAMYNELLAPPVIQNVRGQRYDSIEEEKLRNRVTIDELVREDPRNQTGIRFTVIGTILEILAGRPWFFRRCRDCRHKIVNGRPHAHCRPPNPGEPNDYSYSFRMLISDNTGLLPLTCFSNEAHSIITECNIIVSDQGFTDPYAPPPVLTALEGTVHLFQLHYSTDSTKENPIYILDTVLETGPHLLTQAEGHTCAEPAIAPSQSETHSLTGPETETQAGTHSSSTPISGNTPQASISTALETVAYMSTAKSSTPVIVEKIAAGQRECEKIEVGKRSVRRQLLKEETEKETPTGTKKYRQQE